MREWLAKWLMKSELNNARLRAAYSTEVSVEEAVAKPKPKVRIAVMEVMNGKLLEVATYQQKNHGPDWTTEYYILDESQPLAEQIAVVMTMRGMGV
jgi:hypothetical protein